MPGEVTLASSICAFCGATGGSDGSDCAPTFRGRLARLLKFGSWTSVTVALWMAKGPAAAALSRPLPPVPRVQQEDPGEDPPWLVRVERAEAERLLSGARDGSFVVRPSRGEAPFALSLRFGGRPFHLRVRRRTDGRLALGSEKPCERSFDSLGQLVEHHCREPILLTSRGCPAGRTTLALPPLT
ncbi:SH2 domain-containing adapter protein D isoform X11 [Rhipicephalus sanguineus]|uniref:SH2 domain-containing adapter protein D isoform X11 n=1 Tax=Rhipicephalus sanguineus TaxID=34632 RepID=UPI001894EFD5|nr:SH2 domain-containing adapter protein D isoform X11 [Rhipicephalus sanguineus]